MVDTHWTIHHTGLRQVDRLAIALWGHSLDHHHTGLRQVDRLAIALWGHTLDQHYIVLSRLKRPEEYYIASSCFEGKIRHGCVISRHLMDKLFGKLCHCSLDEVVPTKKIISPKHIF